jgi:hypothetical protein
VSEISRRSLIQAGVFSAAAVMLVPESASAATAAKNLLSRSRFQQYLNSGFTFASGTAKWSATLLQIGDLLPVVVANDDNRFSLTFRTDKVGPPQGTYTFSRPGFTATGLFVIPDPTNRYYQAVINRI